MPYVLTNADAYKGRAFANAKGNTECVEFIKQAMSAPVSALWTEGIKVQKLKANEADPVQRGTAIATFVQGKYPQTGSTGMHAAIYLGQNADGIIVLDQWRAQGRVLQRTIRWTPTSSGLSNDGSAFSVIEGPKQ
jgi:hypothetical protein